MKSREIGNSLGTCHFMAWNFPGGPVLKNLPDNAGDMGLIPGPARFCMLQGN